MNPHEKNRQIRVLIADDHPVVREGLTTLLNRQPEITVVAEASHGREAVELFREHRPDIALIDLRMPELDGVGTIAAILAEEKTARLIVLTTYDGDEDISRALRTGAKAYLLKDVPRQDLITCVRAVYCGGTYLPTALATKLVDHLQGAALTKRELEVLQLLAMGKSNNEIAVALAI
jgi:DNA-binding NarL/FixJ family response regulator